MLCVILNFVMSQVVFEVGIFGVDWLVWMQWINLGELLVWGLQGFEIWFDGGYNVEGGWVVVVVFGDFEEWVLWLLVVIVGMMVNKDVWGFFVNFVGFICYIIVVLILEMEVVMLVDWFVDVVCSFGMWVEIVFGVEVVLWILVKFVYEVLLCILIIGLFYFVGYVLVINGMLFVQVLCFR